MTVTCSICGLTLKSLLIDANRATTEVSNHLVKHLRSKHPMHLGAVSGCLNALLQLSTWYISMQLVSIHEDEKQLRERYEKQGKQILTLLGLDDSQVEAVGLKHKVRKVEILEKPGVRGPQIVQ